MNSKYKEQIERMKDSLQVLCGKNCEQCEPGGSECVYKLKVYGKGCMFTFKRKDGTRPSVEARAYPPFEKE